MLAEKLAGSGSTVTYVDDVFSAYTYSGTTSTQTITNGIDLVGKGGMVWTKFRDTAANHTLVDSSDSFGNYFASNSTAAKSAITDLTPLSNGYSVTTTSGLFNGFTGRSTVSWTFRKAPKFFDVVTFVAGSSANRRLTHSLGTAPGMVIIKDTGTTSAWIVYHKDLGTNAYAVLNSTAASVSLTNCWGSSAPTASDFGINESLIIGTPGNTWVAYIFAHDAAADGLIQCGSFTPSGTAVPQVNLGWEPQFVLYKPLTGAYDWYITDVSRGFTADGNDKYLSANSSSAEATYTNDLRVNSIGFYSTAGFVNTPYIYLAIRRPNKPPTTGAQVYNAALHTGQTAITVGFPFDALWSQNRAANLSYWVPKLVGPSGGISPSSSNAENAYGAAYSYPTMTGVTTNAAFGEDQVTFALRRAPGVFDVVCYTGSVTAKNVAHNLGVAPELMIVKNRTTNGTDWAVFNSSIGATKLMYLNANLAPVTASVYWNDTAPTVSVFSVGTGGGITNGTTSENFYAYLFATKAGISKVGSYTGNGSSQTINCGFTTGARFVLIKRTNSTGDWFVWDTARGIVAASDPHSSLNNTTAEVTTDDSIDPDTSGFIVNQVAATNVNVTSATYIFLAFS